MLTISSRIISGIAPYLRKRDSHLLWYFHVCEGREGDPLAASLLQQALVLVEHFLRDLVLNKQFYN